MTLRWTSFSKQPRLCTDNLSLPLSPRPPLPPRLPARPRLRLLSPFDFPSPLEPSVFAAPLCLRSLRPLEPPSDSDDLRSLPMVASIKSITSSNFSGSRPSLSSGKKTNRRQRFKRRYLGTSRSKSFLIDSKETFLLSPEVRELTLVVRHVAFLKWQSRSLLKMILQVLRNIN